MKIKVIILFLVVLLVFFNFPLLPALVVSDAKTHAVLWQMRVREGETFAVTYQHSVNKRPVREIFRISRGEIILEATEFDAFGAGIQFALSGNETLTNTGGTLRLGNINREMPVFVLRVGTVAEHTLTVNNRTIRLADLTPPGQPVQFSIERASLCELLTGRMQHEGTSRAN